jgi:hypothetical protein
MRVGVALLVAAACGSSAHAKLADAPDGLVDTDAAVDGPPDAPPYVPGATYIKASDPSADADFGYVVALSGDGRTLAVGAPFRSTAAFHAGAVYVYVHSQGAWTFQTQLIGSNTEQGDEFGSSLALSDDGNTLAVGAIGEQSCATGIDGDQQDNACSLSGAAYVFTREQTTWAQQAYVKASNTPYRDGYSRVFGQAVALSADGNTLAVGDPGDPSNATGIDGNGTNITMPLSGAVFVFVRAGAGWSQQAYVKSSNPDQQDVLGASVALSRTGDVMVCGAPGEASAATGVNGSQIDNSKSYAGAAYVFERVGSTWSQHAYLKASNTDHNDEFGFAAAVSGDGATAAIGAWGEASSAIGIGGDQTDNSQLDSGAVYVFANDGSQWAQQAYIKETVASRNADFLGYAVSLSDDGNTLAAGACGSQITRMMQPLQVGAVYELTRAGATWKHSTVFHAAISDMSDLYGNSVALSRDATVLAIGAPGEDSMASGVGGDPTDNSGSGAGAAYVIE